MLDLFWEIRQQQQLSSAETTAGRAQTKANELAARFGLMEARANKALLICEALWTILREKFKMTDEELLNRVKAIDLSDGKLDGQVRRRAMDCPKCGRTTTNRSPQCMYCGADVGRSPFAV